MLHLQGGVLSCFLGILVTKGQHVPDTPKLSATFQSTGDDSSRSQLGRETGLGSFVHSDLDVGCSGCTSYRVLSIFNE